MILYFADRKMNILGQASTTLPGGYTITEDQRVEDTDTGVSTFSCRISFDKKSRAELEAMADAGNYLLKSSGGINEFYTIIDAEIDTKAQEVYIYAEDAGLDLINEIVGEFEASESQSSEWYINKYITDSGFVIGINEIPKSTTRKLKWEGEESVTSRLASIATQFGGYEISYSFDVKNLQITNKYVNIHKQRGQDRGVTLYLNRDIDRIITSRSVANLVTAFLCEGGVPDNKDKAITFSSEKFSYDDGDFFVDGDKLKSRKANEKWSRYLWSQEPNQVKAGEGYIVKPYSYNTTSASTLCSHAIAELKKVCDMEINYEIDIKKLPEGVRIGDRVNIVDNAGEMYVSTRILQLETSETENKHTATLGDHIIKRSGIAQKVAELAEQFAQNAVSAQNALKVAERARELADSADSTAREAETLANEANTYVDKALVAVGEVQEAVKEAQEAVETAAGQVAKVEESVSGIVTTVENAQKAAEDAEKAAETAQAKAKEAETAAGNAETAAAQAAEAAAATTPLAQEAVGKAEDAIFIAGQAQESANDAIGTASAAKSDAAQAKTDVATWAQNLETYKQTVSADYARKTELTETQTSLQAQITSNANQLSVVHQNITVLDETANDAKEKAEAALKDAADAAEAAGESASAAAAAQKAADDAQAAADKAQDEADKANAAYVTANGVLEQAKSDLKKAEEDLATVKGRVDATEAEIEKAEKALAAAQAAVTKAQGDATAAGTAASNAQTKADEADAAATAAQQAADAAASAATNAQNTADTAKGDAANAQSTANSAAAAAAAAQSTANTAKSNAATAQAKADKAEEDAAAAQADADKAAQDLAAAEAVLEKAKSDLEEVQGKVGTTEAEIAAAKENLAKAEAAVVVAKNAADAAQAKADKAYSDAATAQGDANKANAAAAAAQKAADAAAAAAKAAQETVDALAVRVSQNETEIVKTNQEISLKASKKEVEDIQIGGRNLLKFTPTLPLDYTKSNGIGSWAAAGLSETPDGLRMDASETIDSHSFQVPLTSTGAVANNEEVTLSFEYRGNLTRFGTFYFVRSDNSTFGINKGWTLETSETEWKRFSATFTAENANLETAKCVSVLLMYGHKGSGLWVEIKKKSLKLEKGNKATDWTYAPEDLLDPIIAAQATADQAARNYEQHEAQIQLLADSISNLVRGNDGGTLVRQDESGLYYFDISNLEKNVSDVSGEVNDLNGIVRGANGEIDVLKSAAEALSKRVEYVRSYTDENGQPCLELGEGDSTFKVRITNTEIQFEEDGVIPAKINRKMLVIEKTTIKGELQFGDSEEVSGVWVWQRRSNGNLGLMFRR